MLYPILKRIKCLLVAKIVILQSRSVPENAVTPAVVTITIIVLSLLPLFLLSLLVKYFCTTLFPLVSRLALSSSSRHTPYPV